MFSLLVFATLGPFAYAEDPYVVHDINTVVHQESLAITNGRDGEHLDAWAPFLEVGGGHLFTASTLASGRELWIAKASGAEQLGELALGKLNANPGWLTRLGAHVYFAAGDTFGDRELYETDGTPAGTVRVVDLDASGSSDPRGLTALPSKGLLVFSAKTASGREPWASDGTPAGTVLLADLVAGAGDSNPAQFVLAPGGQEVWFTAGAPGIGRNWWATDGTPAGTHLIGKPSSAIAKADFREPVVWNGKLYYSAETALGRELCVTDGTPAGTQLVFDIMPGSAGSELDLSSAVAFNGALYFTANSGNGRELHRFDGTTVVEVADVNLSGDSTPKALTVFGNELYFVATGADSTGSASGSVGRELFRTDGTTTGPLVDLVPGPGGVFGYEEAASLLVDGGRLWFGASDPVVSKVWVTDGTAAGTVQVGEPVGVAFKGQPKCFTALPGGDVRFAHSVALQPGVEPGVEDGVWRSSGSGHVLEAPIVSLGSLGSTPRALFSPDGQRLLFEAEDGAQKGELYGWTTGQGVYRVRDFPKFQGLFNPTQLAALWNGRANLTFFNANTIATGTESWVTDGTAEGTVRLNDAAPGPDPGGGVGFAGLEGRAIFSAGPPGDFQLWSSDGTPSGTHSLASLGSSPGSSLSPFEVLSMGDHVVFVGTSVGFATLGTTDGTPAGTQVVKTYGGSALFPHGLTRWGDAVVFAAGELATGLEPWIFDGQGVFALADIAPGSASSQPTEFTVHDGALYFMAHDGQQVWSLYKVPSIGAAPEVIATFDKPGGVVTLQNLVSGAGGLFARGMLPDWSGHIYTTQGVAGDLVELDAGPGVLFWGGLLPAGRGVYALGRDPLEGAGIYYVDATSSRRVFAAKSGLFPLPNDPTLAGGRLFFGAHFAEEGHELVSVAVPEAYALPLGGASTSGLALAMSPPFLGGTLDARLEGIAAGPQLGALAISRPVPAVATPLLLREGALWLDPVGAMLLAPITSGPTFQQSFAVPSDPTLVGEMLHAQAFVFVGGTWPALASNGVSLHLGL